MRSTGCGAHEEGLIDGTGTRSGRRRVPVCPTWKQKLPDKISSPSPTGSKSFMVAGEWAVKSKVPKRR